MAIVTDLDMPAMQCTKTYIILTTYIRPLQAILHKLHTLLEIPRQVEPRVILTRDILVVGHFGAGVLEAGATGGCDDGFDVVLVEGFGVLGCLEVADVDAPGGGGGWVEDAFDVLWVDCGGGGGHCLEMGVLLAWNYYLYIKRRLILL
jgi:hypothetical protein